MKELRIDRDRAIKLAAVAGLVVLGLSVLPGLLRTPKAPELPPDVGFTASETGRGASLPDPAEPSGTVKEEPPEKGAGRPRRRSRSAKSKRRNQKQGPRNRHSKRHRKTDNGRPKQSKPAATSPPAISPAPTTPVAPAPPIPAQATPAPAPSPPPPAPPPDPGDGSQEFAPH